jgi:hypothetical protein
VYLTRTRVTNWLVVRKNALGFRRFFVYASCLESQLHQAAITTTYVVTWWWGEAHNIQSECQCLRPNDLFVHPLCDIDGAFVWYGERRSKMKLHRQHANTKRSRAAYPNSTTSFLRSAHKSRQYITMFVSLMPTNTEQKALQHVSRFLLSRVLCWRAGAFIKSQAPQANPTPKRRFQCVFRGQNERPADRVVAQLSCSFYLVGSTACALCCLPGYQRA